MSGKRQRIQQLGGGEIGPPGQLVLHAPDDWIGLAPSVWHDRALTVQAFARLHPELLTSLRDEVLDRYMELPEPRPQTLAALLAHVDADAESDLVTIVSHREQNDSAAAAALEVSCRESVAHSAAATAAHDALLAWETRWRLHTAPIWVHDCAIATLRMWARSPRPSFTQWALPSISYAVPPELTSEPVDGFGVPFDPNLETPKMFRDAMWEVRGNEDPYDHAQAVEAHIAVRLAAAEDAGWVEQEELRPPVTATDAGWQARDQRAWFAMHILNGWSRRYIAMRFGLGERSVAGQINAIGKRLGWQLL
ncbi:MAG: hypothetical protein U0075_22080 [Thermomicrobiales bacterium]